LLFEKQPLLTGLLTKRCELLIKFVAKICVGWVFPPHAGKFVAEKVFPLTLWTDTN
jgi:hypothetical protein